MANCAATPWQWSRPRSKPYDADDDSASDSDVDTGQLACGNTLAEGTWEFIGSGMMTGPTVVELAFDAEIIVSTAGDAVCAFRLTPALASGEFDGLLAWFEAAQASPGPSSEGPTRQHIA